SAHPVKVSSGGRLDLWTDVSGLRDDASPPDVPTGDRLREMIRRSGAQRLIDVREMLAIELVKVTVVGRMVLRTIPPVPVAAFGNQYLFEGESAGFIVCSRRLLRIKITRGREIVPGEIIFGRSDPDVEVRVDPGARGNGLELGEAGVALD